MQARVLGAIRSRVAQGEPPPTYRELCKDFGWTSTGTVRDHLQALARKGHVELPGRRHRQLRVRSQPVPVSRVPIIGRVVAGIPVLSEENIEGELPVPGSWISRGSHFALLVNGDSMMDAGIREGDYAVVRQQETADDGEIVVATLDGDTTLKRIGRLGKRVRLVPENPRYRPIDVRSDGLIIQGVVVGLMRAYTQRGQARWRPAHVKPPTSGRRRRRHSDQKHVRRKEQPL
jgi:repressor LexA